MMRSGFETGPEFAVLVVWPILFGLTMTVLRVIVLALFGVQDIGSDHAFGLLLGLPGQITFGLVLAAPLYWLRRSAFRHIVHLLLLAVVFVNVAAFHYEAVFWRLPGISVLYYLREAAHLASSTGAHAPWAAVIAEVVVAWLALVGGAEILIRRQISDEAPRRRWTRALVAVDLLCALFTFIVILFPSIIPRPYFQGSRVPILWAIQSWSIRQSWTAADVTISREDVFEFQRQIGHPVPFGGVDQNYPLCGDGPRHPALMGNGRSVIFIVLESVGTRELGRSHQGEPVMPELRRIAMEAGVSGTIKASGSKSSQALPAIFAGIPPQPALHMLWRRPLSNVQGFPLTLREHGYRTAYIHGGDLSFEQQRSFLKMTGFEELLEYDVSETHPFLAWGYSDDIAFGKLRSWIRNHRESHPDRPYLGTVFTLSTHDPYAIPPDREPVFEGSGIDVQFTESLRFLDEQLGELYRWYLENEAPRGTVLVITGDHAPHLSGTTRLADHEVTNFDVPLIIAGLENDPDARAQPRGAHFDIPATILGAVDLSPGPCDQGVDLLRGDGGSLADRALYSVAGDQLEEFHVWLSDGYVRVDQATRTIRVRGEGTGELPQAAADDLEQRALELFRLTGRLSAYLAKNDAYAPLLELSRSARARIASVERPRFISHRGQSRGELPPAMQNDRATIEQALRDGFEWIELDVQPSADQVPVIMHDYQVTDEAGRPHDVRSLTVDDLRAVTGRDVLTLQEAIAELGDRVNLLIEIKTPRGDLREATVLTLRAASLVRNRSGSHEIVMDTFSPLIAESLAQHCDCEVGLDAPYEEPVTRGWLEDAARSGMSWVYLHFRQASPALIRDAHALGLRVLVYTVNDTGELAHLEEEWPDAVITDRAELIAEFDERFLR